ncbi:hypothetical protein CIG19_13210 [Enterobacterales bacterium CwR94]|nr:hypothetical protein CIG19_13210 [Enterobacterales bacterium CwR94]
MRLLPLLISLLFLQACTPTQQGMGETLKLAVMGPDDVTFTPEQIQTMPYASMYLRVNEGQRIFVVLGFNEHGQQKWITQDRAVVATQHGRIVKTVGLQENLADVTNLAQDPLADALHLTDESRWTRIISWTEQGKPMSAAAQSQFARQPDEVLTIAGNAIPTRVWDEQVTVDALDRQWTNRFWVDGSTGRVIQSAQTLGADYFPVETTLLKPAKL